MPNYNRTGPRGAGRMTGRCRGPCGSGMRLGSRGRMPEPADERKSLEAKLQAMDEERKLVVARLRELD